MRVYEWFHLFCTVPPRSRPQAGELEDHPVCLCGAEGPEQRLVPSVAGNLPVATSKTVQYRLLSSSLVRHCVISNLQFIVTIIIVLVYRSLI